MGIRTLLAAGLVFSAPAALADNCGSEEDCRAVPQNVDAATGIAAGGAATAVLIAVASSGRRRDPDPATTFDPGANLEGEQPPEEPPEEGTASTGTVEDLFGGGSSDAGETPPEGSAEGAPDPGASETPGQPDPEPRRGPPDGPLGDPNDLGGG